MERVLKTDSGSHAFVPRQGLLRADCNAHSRTAYYTTNIAVFVLPVAIILYIAVIRGTLWVLRPALLFVMPQLKGHAFFDHEAHERTNALCFDVRRTAMPAWRPRAVAAAVALASSVGDPFGFKQGCAIRLLLG